MPERQGKKLSARSVAARAFPLVFIWPLHRIMTEHRAAVKKENRDSSQLAHAMIECVSIRYASFDARMEYYEQSLQVSVW
jgi:hypothetical protein